MCIYLFFFSFGLVPAGGIERSSISVFFTLVVKFYAGLSIALRSYDKFLDAFILFKHDRFHSTVTQREVAKLF